MSEPCVSCKSMTVPNAWGCAECGRVVKSPLFDRIAALESQVATLTARAEAAEQQARIAEQRAEGAGTAAMAMQMRAEIAETDKAILAEQAAMYMRERDAALARAEAAELRAEQSATLVREHDSWCSERAAHERTRARVAELEVELSEADLVTQDAIGHATAALRAKLERVREAAGGDGWENARARLALVQAELAANPAPPPDSGRVALQR